MYVYLFRAYRHVSFFSLFSCLVASHRSYHHNSRRQQSIGDVRCHVAASPLPVEGAPHRAWYFGKWFSWKKHRISSHQRASHLISFSTLEKISSLTSAQGTFTACGFHCSDSHFSFYLRSLSLRSDGSVPSRNSLPLNPWGPFLSRMIKPTECSPLTRETWLLHLD